MTPGIMVFVPMYNCAAQIVRVARQLEDPRVKSAVAEVVFVDNRSTDDTINVLTAYLKTAALPIWTILRNDDNYGLGGSHKVAIEQARARGHAFVLVFHGDDQGVAADIAPYLEAGAHDDVDFLLGARFMPGSKLVGYSMLRTVANKAFNILFSLISGKRIYDLGSGLNLMRVSAFQDDFHRRYADDLTFNYYLILGIVGTGRRLKFFPLTWREEDQVSNAKLGRMGFQLLALLGRRGISKTRFLEQEHRATPREAYPSTVVCSSAVANAGA